MRLNIWYFWYYSYVQFLTSEHMIKIDLTGMKTCETLNITLLHRLGQHIMYLSTVFSQNVLAEQKLDTYADT